MPLLRELLTELAEIVDRSTVLAARCLRNRRSAQALGYLGQLGVIDQGGVFKEARIEAQGPLGICGRWGVIQLQHSQFTHEVEHMSNVLCVSLSGTFRKPSGFLHVDDESIEEVDWHTVSIE